MTAKLTYAELTTPLTREQILDDVAIPIYESYGFDVRNEEDRAELEIQAEAIARESQKVAHTARSGTLDAEGEGLTEHAADKYSLARRPATATVGTVTLTDSTGAPQPFADRQLWIVDHTTGDILFFVDAVTVPANGSAPATIRAEKVGSLHNLDGSELMLATPLPGLTMTVEPFDQWITSAGTDTESDDSLRTRCRANASKLTPPREGTGLVLEGPFENHNGVTDHYVRWALESTTGVNRVRVISNPNAVWPSPAVTVIVAGPLGAPTPEARLAAEKAITSKAPLGISVAVLGAEEAGQWLAGTVKVRADKIAAAKVLGDARLRDHFGGTPIRVHDGDGILLPGLPIGERARVSQLVEILMAIEGVEDVELRAEDGTLLRAGDLLGALAADMVFDFKNRLAFVAA